MVSDSENTYLTTAQAAKLLMVSSGSVRGWIGNGLLDAQLTPGGHRRILRRELERFAHDRGLALASDRSEHLRILIVEDDEQFAEYLRRLLTRLPEPVDISVAHSGFEAGFLARDPTPDVILLDLMMPTLDGFEVCAMLKHNAKTRNIRIVAMTGHYSNENVTKIMALGAVECLAKPFEVEELMRAIGLRSGRRPARLQAVGRLS